MVRRIGSIGDAAEVADAPFFVENGSAVRKTEQVAAEAIANTDLATQSDRPIDPSRVASFLNPARDIINVGLDRIDLYNQELGQHLARAEKLHKDVEKLIELNKKIRGLKDDAVLDQTEIQDLLTDLDIQFDAKTTVAAARHHFDSLISSKNSEMSSLFTTKIQVAQQNIQMIIDILKDVLRKKERLDAAIQGIIRGN